MVMRLTYNFCTGSYALFGAAYGQGSGPIWLDNVNCNPDTNARLSDCPANAVGVHNCDHSEDAGVICLSKYGDFFREHHMMRDCLHIHHYPIPSTLCPRKLEASRWS